MDHVVPEVGITAAATYSAGTKCSGFLLSTRVRQGPTNIFFHEALVYELSLMMQTAEVWCAWAGEVKFNNVRWHDSSKGLHAY